MNLISVKTKEGLYTGLGQFLTENGEDIVRFKNAYYNSPTTNKYMNFFTLHVKNLTVYVDGLEYYAKSHVKTSIPHKDVDYDVYTLALCGVD